MPVAVLRQELRDLEGDISKVRQKRKFLENSSNALAAQRQRVRQIYLFVGRVEQALENVSASRNVDKLRECSVENIWINSGSPNGGGCRPTP